MESTDCTRLFYLGRSFMRNYKLVIAYDGTRYQGWQRQANTDDTIQCMLERAVSEYVGYPVEINGSGRTDSGVHAWGQTANVKVAGKLDEVTFLQGLNEKLPEDIRIRSVELVKNSFHARKSAVSKRYVYSIDRREKPDVFTRKYCYHVPRELNVDAMRGAAKRLTGTKNFMAFCDKKEDVAATRTIFEIMVREEGSKLILTYFGTGFLYHMVRILTGTLLEVGLGERSADELFEVIAKQDRKQAGFLAPARGLLLKEVYYE